MTGLESVIDVSALDSQREQEEKKRMVQILSDPDLVDPGNTVGQDLNRTVQHMLMRAKANSHRHYEIYTIHTTADIAAQTLRELFEQNPQQAAELIRQRGNMLYSDRIKKDHVLIT